MGFGVNPEKRGTDPLKVGEHLGVVWRDAVRWLDEAKADLRGEQRKEG